MMPSLRSIFSTDYRCEHPPYTAHLVSHSPLVIYIKNFITPAERAHLLKLGNGTFTRSGVTTSSSRSSSNNNPHNHNHGQPATAHNHPVRTSQSTTLPPSDPVVSCIETRALLFQSPGTPRSHLEPLQLVRYAPGEHYHFHTDWFTAPGAHAGADRGGNRRTSFFVYVRVEEGTLGGGTNFPRLRIGWWCEQGIVDCDAEWEAGVTFRPVEGNAVFWANLIEGEEDGLGGGGGGRRGDERTLHAGLPVLAGGKVGMNIWTREGPVGEGIRGG
ncbi:uncharacterized protein THITE_2145661 [Thermothielavioides terrestris NRRL 8126]|uniref:Fe2OG dioxygenase domain-containing protein n=1 Tax=Thermothielavioides terrestris (strain ATCC 38088 / NRRL 8126) TaxID=578455 RepID=G2R6V5_THETT|nr:uncharacterized protein THITE_2145661 [Thermothielavioides terrestris NRRL 8126]AEO68533.1 hypothetical protein THITE_2145661 [Thermothielavioides terrestris NRRL 8126]